MVSDLGAGFNNDVYACDASLWAAEAVKATLHPEVRKELHRRADCKGSHARLDSALKGLRSEFDLTVDEADLANPELHESSFNGYQLY